MRKISTLLCASLFVLALPALADEQPTHSCTKAEQAHCTKAEAANCKKDKDCAKEKCADAKACHKEAAKQKKS